MTVVSNNLEGGVDGVAITVVNSGGASGTPFDAILGSGFKYSAAAALQGSMGARVAATLAGAGEWFLANNTHEAGYFKIRLSAAPTSDTHIARIHTASGRIFSLHLVGTGTNVGKIRVDDGLGTAGVWTFPTALDHTGTVIYRVEYYIVAGSTTSNGTIKVAYYVGNSTSPVDAIYNNTTANVGAGAVFTLHYQGKYSATAESIDVDEFKHDSAATDFIGVATTLPPVVTPLTNQNVAAAAAVTVPISASSPSGTITGYAWSYLYPTSGAPTLTGATTNNVSFTAGAAGSLYILQCIVTDSNSLTTTVTVEVRVPTAGDALVLPGAAAATVGSWANVGGAATPGDAMADSTDVTYTESGTLNATETSERYRLQPMIARVSGGPIFRLEQAPAGTTTVTVRLYEGTTLRQSWVQAINTVWTDYPVTVSNFGAISDWGNIFIEVAGTSP